MYDAVAVSILKRYQYENKKLYLLINDAYTEIAQKIQCHHPDTEIRSFEDTDAAFSLPYMSNVLLLAEPEAYLKYKLYRHLDFSDGEPQVAGTESKVLIFPKDSLCRVFSEEAESFAEKEKLLAAMKAEQKYKITTVQGTELFFESRRWLPLDFEVCTAPKEKSVNGVIVVDGALFFQKIEEPVSMTIRNGKIDSITATSPEGERLVAEYLKMTERDLKDPVNTQLAEIGIGFCKGAVISDCFMEAETVLHTCHFCFGNNICYGGKNASEFHGASVLIKDPIFTCV